MMYQESYEEAIEKFETCIKINDINWPNFQILTKIGYCYYKLGQTELALKNFNKGLTLSDVCYCENEEKIEWQNMAQSFIDLISQK